MPDTYVTDEYGIKVRIPETNDPYITDEYGIKIRNPKYTEGPQIGGPGITAAGEEARGRAGYSKAPEFIARPLDYLRELGRAGQSEQVGQRSTVADKVIGLIRPMAQAGAFTAGLNTAKNIPGPPAAKLIGGAGAAGLAAIGIDTPLQQLFSGISGLQPKTMEESLNNTASQLAINEVGAGLLKGVYKGGKAIGRGYKEFTEPIPDMYSGVGDIARLEPTLSQINREKGNDRAANVLGWLENTFAPRSLKKRQLESAQRGKEWIEAQALGAQQERGAAILTAEGHPGTSILDPQETARTIKGFASSNLAAIQKESNAKASVAKIIAQNRPILVPSEAPPPLAQPGPDQHLVNGKWNRVVRGPTSPNITVQKMQDFLQERQQYYGGLEKAYGDDVENINIAQNFLRRVNAGPNGINLPISFQEAWDYKQELAKAAYKGIKFDTTGKVIPGQGKRAQGVVMDWANSLDDDIERDILKWPRRGYADSGAKNQVALQSYRAAKETVALRYELFGKKGIQDLVEANNGTLELIRGYTKDPDKLQKILDAGEIPVPNPKAPGFNFPQKILSTNMRQELAGHEIANLLQKHTSKVDPLNPGRVREVNIRGIIDDLHDPEMQKSYGMLFSRQSRDNLDRLLTQVAITQEKSGGSPNRPSVYLGYAGLAIPAALFTQHVTNFTIGTMIGGTAALGGFALARVIQNPRVARSLYMMAAGQPTGVSQAYLSREIVGALQGTGAVLTMVGKDGKEEKGTILSDGTWEFR